MGQGDPMSTAAADAALLQTLNGIPKVDFPANLRAAVVAGRGMTSILREIVSLRRGVGRLTPNEFFYYRLWDPALSRKEKGRFVGKMAQHPMHLACNDRSWFAPAADKLLFQTLMAGCGLPVPRLVAVIQEGRWTKDSTCMARPEQVASLLRTADIYPLFAKPIGGKYSLAVVSADAYDHDTDEVRLLGGERRDVAGLAAELAGGSGYIVQKRLSAHPWLAALFGPRLWSVRIIVLISGSRPIIHRAVAKIATGRNAADNFWRNGNMLGAINLETGLITRVVRGTGVELTLNEVHPDTGRPILGTPVPDWQAVQDLVLTAAKVFPGIRTQSWDIALADAGPVLLEVNWGGDLNLSQLAHGTGVLDQRYAEHLRRCGYQV